MAQIAVIIPVHNRRVPLRAAIKSVLAQSMTDFELVVVDDGSTDNCCEKLESEYRELKLISTEAKGVSHARNVGVAASNAPLLAFLDSDDLWHKKKLAEHLIFHRQGNWRISQTEEIWIRNGTRVNPPRHLEKKEGDLFASSLNHCMITPSSVILERKLFEEQGGFDEKLPACEDYALWLRITRKYSVGLLRKKLLTRHGGHADQLSTRFVAMDRFRVQALLDLLDLGLEKKWQKTSVLQVVKKKIDILEEGAKCYQNSDILSLASNYRSCLSKHF